MLGQLIDRFGVEAVMGRPVLGVGEMIRIQSAERIARAYLMKADSKNWGKWAAENKKDAEKLAEIEMQLGKADG